MSQYSSRIYVKVSDKAEWSKLSDMDFGKYGFFANPVLGLDKEVFEIDGDWSCFEDELIDIAEEIAKRIPNCVIIGDTTNINVDPYDFIVYYLGDEVYSDEFEGDMFWETQIDDPINWLRQADVNLTPKRLEHIKQLGIEE